MRTYDKAAYIVTPCTFGTERVLLACRNNRVVSARREIQNNQPDMPLDYVRGMSKPNYPLPVDEFTNVLAMPYENVTPRFKRWILRNN